MEEIANNEKLIGLSEGKSFGLQLMLHMKQYVDNSVSSGDSTTLATNSQIRAIIAGNYTYDYDEQEPNDDTSEIEEATDDDIETIIDSMYNS